jgi:hypothetical protein
MGGGKPKKMDDKLSSEKRTFWKPGRMIAAGLITGTAVVAGLISNVGTITDFIQPSLSGPWLVTMNIKESSLKRYDSMNTTFQLYLVQDGHSVTGTGEKTKVDGQDIPIAQHQQMKVSGSVSGGRVSLQYTQTAGADGASRKTDGMFDFKVIRSGIFSRQAARMEGTFSGTAASTSGDAVAIPNPE